MPSPSSRSPSRFKWGARPSRSSRTGGAESPAARGPGRGKHASQYGVVYGGLMEFEATLTGADWLGELKKLGLINGTALAAAVPAEINLRVGNSQHAATARIVPRLK